MSGANYFLKVKANVPEQDIEKTVTDLVLLLITATYKRPEEKAISRRKEELKQLFGSHPENKREGDTSVNVGHPLEEACYYILRWARLKEGYQFQLEGLIDEKNKEAVQTDFRTAFSLIIGYFKNKGIRPSATLRRS